MAEEKQNPLAILGLIALILIAGFFIFNRAKKSTEESIPMMYWVSDTSDFEMEAPKSADPGKLAAKAPDGKPMYISRRLKCPQCETEFEAYRMTPSGGGIPGVKHKGEKRWIPFTDAMNNKSFSNPKCPNCNAEKTADWPWLTPERKPESEVEDLMPDLEEAPAE